MTLLQNMLNFVEGFDDEPEPAPTSLIDIDALAEAIAGAVGGPSDPSAGITEPTVPLAIESDWTSNDPASWNFVASSINDIWGFSKTDSKQRVNAAAEAYFNEFGAVPNAQQLLEYPTLQNYMNVLSAGTPFVLPPFFEFNGDIYRNDPLSGPRAFPSDPNLRTAFGAIIEDIRNSAAGLEVHTQDSITELLSGFAARTGRRGGGGGGGGGGRAAIAFDKDSLIRRATDMWRDLMIEEPDDMAKMIDDYTREANSFWRRSGGRLDFDTFILSQMEKTSRYKTLYNRKGEHESAAEYMSRFRQITTQAGLSSRGTQQALETGLRSGASAQGFAERLSRTREARLRNTGQFSQRLAATAAQLGALMR